MFLKMALVNMNRKPNQVCVLLQDFGLDVETFRQMVGDCPSHFLNLAIACCNVRNAFCLVAAASRVLLAHRLFLDWKVELLLIPFTHFVSAS